MEQDVSASANAAVLFDAEQWRVVVDSRFGGVETHSISSSASPTGALAGLSLGAVGAFQMSGPPQVFRRSSASIREHQLDLLKVCIQLTGRTILHQDGREVTLVPGQLALYDTARPYEMKLDGDWSCGVLTVPRDSLNLPWQVIVRSMEHAFTAADGTGAVLAGLLASVIANGAPAADAAAQRVGNAGVQLLAGTLVEDDGPSFVDPADALRMQVMSFVHLHLSDFDLSHAMVASAHHISARTLDRLFADEPRSVVGHIRHARLEAVKRELADPSVAHVTIAEIAAFWGFHDPAHFSRLFKDTYAVSPSEARGTR